MRYDPLGGYIVHELLDHPVAQRLRLLYAHFRLIGGRGIVTPVARGEA